MNRYEQGENPMDQNPWNRDHDISFLKIWDIEKGSAAVVKRFDYLIEAPNWSKDGKSLYFNSLGKIHRLTLDGGDVHEVCTGYADNCNNDHVLSPDGGQIAVSHGAREDGKSRIYVVDIAGETPRLVTPLGPSYLHGWSPDGSTLAYCAERGGEYDVYTIPVQGGTETKLTHAKGLNDGPEYDPTGEFIWFNSVRSGLMQAWRMRRDGREQTQMTFDETRNIWFPHISPDGEQVVLLAYKKGDLLPQEHLPHKRVDLCLMNADGSDLQTLCTLFGGQGTVNVNSWSPDSKRFAFVSYELPDGI